MIKISSKKDVDEKLIEERRLNNEVGKMSTEMIEAEMKNELATGMDERLTQLAEKLSKTKANNNRLSVIQIKNILSSKAKIGRKLKYSNAELVIAFDYYKKFIELINQNQVFMPTKKNFCSFIGISSLTYDDYRKSDDDEKRNIIEMIDDYITDTMLTSAQNGEVRELTTMFRSKAEHGMVEATAPIVIEHKAEADIDDIKKQIAMINSGKSLKTIQLDKDSRGVYTKED